MKEYLKSVFLAKLAMTPILFLTAYLYYLWYQVLVARGFGYLFNGMKYQMPFMFARLLLLIATILGFIIYQFTRKSLPIYWRIGYVLIIGFGIAHFIVHWIILQFGPEPFWSTM